MTVSLSRKVVASDLADDGMQMAPLNGWLRLPGSTPAWEVTNMTRERIVRMTLKSNILAGVLENWGSWWVSWLLLEELRGCHSLEDQVELVNEVG